MVHLRLNETEANPNPHVNFITALPMPDAQDSETARQLLRALAAQVRPVMKAHGFTINSFEEYEYNSVFAGRNWNNGETVELVLRRANGSYCPSSWLMSTLCHELAHIKHMNHGPAFQALWARLRREVRQLQDKGYYGDGYWSSGIRLADSAHVTGDGIETGDFPEYMCGGAQARTRPNSQRRRRHTSRRPRDITPSLHTGRQTAKRRKAGGRVTSKFAFTGDGHSLTDTASSSKGKRAISNRAREERALAAEKRLNALTRCTDTPLGDNQSHESTSDSDSDIEFIQETDAERRRALLESRKPDSGENDESLGKGLLWRNFDDDFVFIPSGQTGVSGSQPQESSHTLSRKQTGKLATESLVKNEVEFRKKEALGLGPTKDEHRRLGKAQDNQPSQKQKSSSLKTATGGKKPGLPPPQTWSCLICTLENQAGHLACAACATPRGQNTYTIR